jgi:hypothetical protein
MQWWYTICAAQGHTNQLLFLHPSPFPTGSLPATWSRLGALRDLRLSDNSLSGTLPPSWAALTRLKLCVLHRNTLSGPLPSTWSGMAALENLELHTNNLTGG